LARPFVLVWTLWAVEVVTAEGKKWLALAGTRMPIRARFGKMGRREKALQIEDIDLQRVKEYSILYCSSPP
jgi:hypothetical protein